MHPSIAACLELGSWSVNYEVQRPPAGQEGPPVVGVTDRWDYSARLLGDSLELVVCCAAEGKSRFHIFLETERGSFAAFEEWDPRDQTRLRRVENPQPGATYLHAEQDIPILLDFPCLPASWHESTISVGCEGFEQVVQKIVRHKRKGWLVRMFGSWQGKPFTGTQEYPVDGPAVWTRAQKLRVRSYPIVQGKRLP